MSSTAEIVAARRGNAASPESASAELALTAKLLKVSTVSMAVQVASVVATSQMDTPGFLSVSVLVSGLVMFVSTIWLALRVHSPGSAILVAMLLLVTSLLATLTALAPFAVLGKLCIWLSVRDRATKILKPYLTSPNSAEASLGQRVAIGQSLVASRFAWERWLFGAVIAVVVGTVAYSAYQSIINASF